MVERIQDDFEAGKKMPVSAIINNYAKTWSMLLQYDEGRLERPKGLCQPQQAVAYDRLKDTIALFKAELMCRGEAGDLFGKERESSLQSILGNIEQTFDGNDLYPSVEEKAAHLLYFIIKDHPFADGNKRIGSFLFLIYLSENNLLDLSVINANGLVTLALLVAESNPRQKVLMILLIVNLLNGRD